MHICVKHTLLCALFALFMMQVIVILITHRFIKEHDYFSDRKINKPPPKQFYPLQNNSKEVTVKLQNHIINYSNINEENDSKHNQKVYYELILPINQKINISKPPN